MNKISESKKHLKDHALSDSLVQRLIELDEGTGRRKRWSADVVDYIEGFYRRLSDPATRAVYSCDAASKDDDAIAWTLPQEDAGDMASILQDVKEKIEFSGIKLSSGNYYGFTPNTGVYAASLGVLLASAINVQSAYSHTNPGATKLEERMVRWIAQVLGFPETASGVLLPGGSSATVASIACARDSMRIACRDFDRSVVYTTSARHHCLDKALCVVGMREAVLRCVPLDQDRKIKLSFLESMINMDKQKGLIPFLVFATFGSTDSGGIDPIDRLADVTERENIWLHVDAAYGGFYYMLDEVKAKHKGLERSDSIAIDPHKALNQPFGSAAIIVRQGSKLKQSMTSHWPDDNNPEADDIYSPSDYSFEQSRPFRALPLWVSLKLMGVDTFRLALQEKMDLAKYCYDELSKLPNIIIGPYPELPTVTFRVVLKSNPEKGNEITNSLLDKLNSSGKLGMSATTMDAHLYLRVVTNGYRTHISQVKQCIHLISLHSAWLVESYSS